VKGSFERLELTLDHPFGISRGTTETTEALVVRLEVDGETGLGAAAPAAYYGETPETVAGLLPDLLAAVEGQDPHDLQGLHDRLEDVVGKNPAAKAAVDVAAHDLVARLLDVPLFRYLGLDPTRSVPSSFTVSLADPETMARRASEAVDAGHDHLKVKLGGDRDEAALAAVREAAPGAAVRVDANAGWRPKEAVRMCGVCADHGVEFVEQPVPPGEGLGYVHDRSPLPIAADESCVTAADVPTVADSADVVNVKLMKCGGVRPAVEQIHAARAHGLEVMLGCMLEPNVSIAAAAHLTPLVDHADLDGSLLLADDPYEGIPIPECDLTGTERGTGVRRRPTE
jgi:L-alanine-DL-glutamate epimerase-like enolase superfamily enzyme